MSRQNDPFTQYILAREKKLLGEKPSPELTHVFRMGAFEAMKFVRDFMQQHIQQRTGPAN